MASWAAGDAQNAVSSHRSHAAAPGWTSQLLLLLSGAVPHCGASG